MASNFSNYDPPKHGVGESTLMKATQVGHHYNLEADVDIDNGSVAAIGDYIRDDVFEAKIPAIGDKIVLILSEPEIYEEYKTSMQEESNFYNAAGETMRGYETQDTDRFSLSTEAFDDDAAPAVGEYVGVTGTGYKLTTLGTEKPSTTSRGFLGHIYAVAANGNYRIWVDKNAQVEA
jgi:hypothetical protein